MQLTGAALVSVLPLTQAPANARWQLSASAVRRPATKLPAASRPYVNGLPRALNNAATAALMAAAADSKGIVDDVCAKKAVAELART